MFHDDEDDGLPATPTEEPDLEKVGDYNLGDEFGTKIGEGHDEVEDEVT